MSDAVWIAAACAAVGALFIAAVFYGTRDTGNHSAGRERHPLQAVSGWAAAVLAWWIDGRRTSPPRIPPAENPDPPRATPFERPLTDWLRDSVVMEAIRITEEGQ